jgi:chemotaxis protein methyltransferase CheR
MAISPIEFDYLRKLVREQTAIVIDDGKEYIAESRLAYLVAQEGLPSVSALLQQLRANSFNGLHRKVVNAMTNNETWFFRVLLPFEALRTKIIPALITSRNIEKTIRIWSAACSSGQEPYSLAMMIRKTFPN